MTSRITSFTMQMEAKLNEEDNRRFKKEYEGGQNALINFGRKKMNWNFKDEFYPTPKGLAKKMCQYLDGREERILEPSAGKGDLIEAIIERLEEKKDTYWRETTCIDFCEKDEDLSGIISSKYSEAALSKMIKARDELRSKERFWDNEVREYRNILTQAEKAQLMRLERRVRILSYINFQMVQEDFLEYNTWKRFDAIVMNPPFSEGAKHLLKAISLMRFGGKIVCLLNKETIANPYTNERKLLTKKLEEFNAEIEFLPMEFMSDDSERKTSVEVALVKMTIPEMASYKSQILEGLDKAREEKRADCEATEVSTKVGWIDALIEQCEYELEAGIKLYGEYKAILPYMCRDYDKSTYSGNMVTLKCGDRDFEPNDFAHAVRAKYWKKFFSNKEFERALTGNLTDTFNSIVNEAADYEFTKENVAKIIEKMNVLMVTAREDTILKLFDKLSSEHSWYPECSGNIHYYNGWATNKAHKINDKKVILPINGFSAFSGDLDIYRINRELSDIEKVLNYLAVGSEEKFNYIDFNDAVSYMVNTKITKNIPCKYFSVTFYKKGTCHITFREEAKVLIEKLNILGSQKKGWLPPCYGKKAYSDMTEEEKAVIDEFQGKEEYEKVLTKSDYYLDGGSSFDGVFALESAS